MIEFFLSIAAVVVISLLIDMRSEKKDNEEHKKTVAMKHIADEFKSITNCIIFDNNIIPNLEGYLSCLKKLRTDENIIEHIKPYDEYHVGKIKKHLGYASIIIDGNGEPRLSPRYIDLKSNNKYRDYEISACFNEEQLEDFIKQCKKIKVNHDIEIFRKNKVEEGLKK